MVSGEAAHSIQTDMASDMAKFTGLDIGQYHIGPGPRCAAHVDTVFAEAGY